MKHKEKRLFRILINSLLIIIILSVVAIKILVHFNNMGTYYLYRTAGWSSFLKVTKNMDTQNFSNGTIYSQNRLESSYSKRIEEAIEKSNNSINKIFGQTKVYPLRIIVFPTSKEYDKAFNNLGDSDAHYDTYALYLSLDELTDYSLIHEYAHYKTESFCKDNKINSLAIPMWFNEGVAEYLSFQYRTDKANKVSLEKLIDFRELNKQQQITKGIQQGYDVYFQGYLSIKKIIELTGENSIRNIILDLDDMDFYDAFYKNIGLRVEEFQKLLK